MARSMSRVPTTRSSDASDGQLDHSHRAADLEEVSPGKLAGTALVAEEVTTSRLQEKREPSDHLDLREQPGQGSHGGGLGGAALTPDQHATDGRVDGVEDERRLHRLLAHQRGEGRTSGIAIRRLWQGTGLALRPAAVRLAARRLVQVVGRGGHGQVAVVVVPKAELPVWSISSAPAGWAWRGASSACTYSRLPKFIAAGAWSDRRCRGAAPPACAESRRLRPLGVGMAGAPGGWWPGSCRSATMITATPIASGRTSDRHRRGTSPPA